MFGLRGRGTLRLAPRAEENGPSFRRTIAEAAFTADLNDYNLLRPALLELKREWPKPA
jgi:hypothetical protein